MNTCITFLKNFFFYLHNTYDTIKPGHQTTTTSLSSILFQAATVHHSSAFPELPEE